MPYQELHDREIISLSGSETIPFLQGLITNDATKLAHGEAIYALLLSPQGKFLHDFFLIPDNKIDKSRILLDVNITRADDLIARLNLYKLRAQIKIEKTDIKVTALFSEELSANYKINDAVAIADPRLNELGYRVYSKNKLDNENYSQIGDYNEHRIKLGVPDAALDMYIDKSLPLEFALDKLNAISFSKGCYVGQEVTARSKFRSQMRKNIYCITSEDDLPPLGTIITLNEEVIGEIRSVSGNSGIALLKSDKLEENTNKIIAGNVEIKYHLASWNK